MYSFITLIWPHTDREAKYYATYIADHVTAHFPLFKTVYSTNNLMIFQKQAIPDRMQAYPLDCPGPEGGGGVVLGKLFTRPSSTQAIAQNAVLSAKDSRKIIKTRCRHLMDQFWGRYVAFIQDSLSGKIRVIRDPVGGLPCFYTEYQGVTICFSDMEDIIRLPFLSLTINWSYVASHLISPYQLRPETGLNEVFELLAGEAMVISCNDQKTKGRRPTKRATDYLWDIGKISRVNIQEDPGEAAGALHDLTQSCVSAWAASYDNIGHRLSGGLDSSIVLAGLAKADNSPDITCFNFFTTKKDGDERLYARLMADQAKVRLIERERLISDVILDRLLHIPRTPKPGEYLFTIEQGHSEYQLAREHNIDVLFSGFGGDQLFLLDCKNLAVSDYFKKHAIHPGLFKIARQSARIQNISLWASLRQAFRDRNGKQNWRPDNLYSSQTSLILNMPVINSLRLENTPLPWLKKAHGLTEGKLFHLFLFSLVPSYNGISLREDFLETVDPLFSQPLIELGMRIPTWVLQSGGMERGLARLAFIDDLPREILCRASKGGIMNHINSVFTENASFIKKFLLEGLLVEKKLLNKEYLAQALDHSKIHTNADLTNIMFALYVEAWLKSWSSRKIF